MSEVDGAWATLQRELDLWGQDGKTATLWWRDDDAVAATEELQKLDTLSLECGVSVCVAVIPKLLDDSLPGYLQGRSNITVFQHGYAHQSHAAKGVKKIEMGGERDTAEIERELAEGYRLLSAAFREQFVSVLVPPWNRIEPRVFDTLAKIGFVGVSSMWARQQSQPVPDLTQINTHLDPVHWRGGRGFIGEYRALSQLCRHLFSRRKGLRDPDEPTGILTHHLDQNERVWDFCRRLFRVLNRHSAVQWLNMGHDWATY